MNPHYLYLLVDLGCVAMPFLLSFDKKVAFFKRWSAFWKANLLVALVFIVWDVYFTSEGIWGFNDAYLTGIHLGNLPIEEVLFFIAIPYACVFMYASIKAWIPVPNPSLLTYIIFVLFLLGTLAMTGFNAEKYYTFSAGLAASLVLLVVLRKKPEYSNYLLITYLIALIPFTLANGILTGLDFYQYPTILTDPSLVADQIVWYNNDHNLGVRFFSIPFDDFIYGFALIAANIMLFEYYSGSKKPTSTGR
jgi:lycopene cyclase domain-containing protein